MNYRQIRPSAAVARYVEFYWTLEDCSPASAIQRIVPDGRAGMILNFAAPYESQTNGCWRVQPQCFLIGQITGPLLLRPSGPAAMIGIQFRPHGIAGLLQLPVAEFTDSSIALGDLSSSLLRELGPALDAPTLPKAVAALDCILHAIAARSAAAPDVVSYAVTAIQRTGGLMSTAEIAGNVGWSSRQLQRRFKDAVGIPPKLFARMQRFQAVVRAMDDPAPNWVEAAAHCGYFDQAHLIRDFREFTGKTPTALLSDEIDLSRRFVQPGFTSHFSKTTDRPSR